MSENQIPLIDDRKKTRSEPLASRMRPHELTDFIGQEHLLGSGRPLEGASSRGSLHSMIFWGPPGTGKTTLANLMAQSVGARLTSLSAVLSGVKDIRKAIEEAILYSNSKTVLFVDEVHRFNKAQQDAFLPHVENGTVIFLGATTENPAFEVNNALLSRCRVYILKPLSNAAIRLLVQRACERELNDITINDEALEMLASYADGDARRALNTLEIAEQLATNSIKVEQIASAMGEKYRRFDKGGEAFYDQISALHKAVRGSSPDAALYWMVRMLDGGCDPEFIARRLTRMASEDVGNADPRALDICLGAWDSYKRLGSPEGDLGLAQAVIYLASVPKSNAVYKAFESAKEFVRNEPSYQVPLRLRNAPTQLAKTLDHGAGYRYAHDESNAFAAGERYFPEEIEDEQFYFPTDRGLEERIAKRLIQLKALDDKYRKENQN
tara:strand:+ start:450 stop:1766 length:1317 start_codon:yes stop_codon:yes gene_type:complete